MGHSRPLFHLLSSFRTVQLLKKLAASGIRTQIVRAVGENADHYTTTTALLSLVLYGLFETTEVPSNTLTHCMAALLRIVDSVWHKELGKHTERRPPQMEQTPPGPAGTREVWLLATQF